MVTYPPTNGVNREVAQSAKHSPQSRRLTHTIPICCIPDIRFRFVHVRVVFFPFIEEGLRPGGVRRAFIQCAVRGAESCCLLIQLLILAEGGIVLFRNIMFVVYTI
jgi:hypothetical protein